MVYNVCTVQKFLISLYYMKTDSYYTDKSRVNNSALGYFLKSPRFFHKMMTEDVEQESKTSLEFGTALHMYVLQPNEFKHTYRIADFEIPRLSQQKAFCEEFIRLRGKGPRIAAFEAYKASYATKGKSDDKIAAESIALLLRYKTYIQSCDGRKYLTWSQFNKIKDLYKEAMKHKFAKTLLETKGECEYHINWECCGVDCKSLLDKVIIDEDSKTITLIDLKTTSHIATFKDSVDTYDYFRQMQFYKMALKYLIDNGFYKYKFDEFTFKCYIIAFDTSDTKEVKVFDMLNGMVDKEEQIKSILTQIKWHIDNNLWDHSRDYYEGDGVEKLV